MIKLYQFQRSHFKEKARFALDLKGVTHTRITLLPGPHMLMIKNLTGQSATPVLEMDGEITAGSSDILRELDIAFPEPPLFPAGFEMEIKSWLDWLDADVGPAVRCALFSMVLDEPDYAVRIFGEGKSRLKLMAYRAMMPIMKPVIAKANGVTSQQAVEEAFTQTRAALDKVAAGVAETGYLVGGRFTAADLTAAALLSITVDLQHPDMRQPQPLSPAMQKWYAMWADHPGAQWVQKIYQDYRG